jgi:cell division protein ZapA
MSRPVRVRLLGKEYPLLVEPEAETTLRELAAYVDDKLQAFREAHPEKTDTTTAVITALAIAEDLFSLQQAHETLRQEHEHLQQILSRDLDYLDHLLEQALARPPGPFNGHPLKKLGTSTS